MKKFKFIIKILFIVILLSMSVFLIKKSSVKAVTGIVTNDPSFGRITWNDHLGRWAYEHRDQFLSLPVGNFMNKTIDQSVNAVNTAGNSGVAYCTSACFYHNAIHFGGTREWKITTLIDFINTDAGFIANSYYNGSTSVGFYTLNNIYAMRLAAAIYETSNCSPAWTSTPSDFDTLAGRKPIYPYFFEAVKNGAIKISSRFNTNQVNENDASESFKNGIAESVRNKINNKGSEVSNYRKITKKDSNVNSEGYDESVKVISMTSTQAILGPFKVEYREKGVASITIKDITNPTIQYATTSNATEWHNVTEIPNNTNFYLKVTNANLTTLNDLEITIKQATLEWYRARLVLCEHQGAYHGQNLGYYTASGNNKEGSVSYKVKNNGSIIARKIDKYAGNDIAIKIKVQTDAGENTWLKANSDGTYNYEETFANATEYTTTTDSTNPLTIAGLSLRQKYKVWETQTADPDVYKLEDQGSELLRDSNDKVIAVALNNYSELTYTATFKNNPILGKIIVNKKDKEIGKPVDIKFKIETRIAGKTYWLASINGADKYNVRSTTGSVYQTINGVRELPDLPSSVEYRIWETEILDPDYSVSEQEGYNETYKYTLLQDWFTLKTYKQQEYTYIGQFVNLAKRGDLGAIEKVDADLGIALTMGYKLQAFDGDTEIGWVVRNSDGTYKYNETQEKATEFRSNEKTENLSTDVLYSVWETNPPNENYFLSDQDGYDASKNAVLLAEKIKLSPDSVYKIDKVKNYSRCTIKGYVWVDKAGKGETTDSKYTANGLDTRLAGVPVRLYKKGSTTPIGGPVLTDSNGEYLFDKLVLYRDLNNYYVQFDYAGMTIEGKAGKNYIPVAYNSKELKNIIKDGSRAMMQDVATYDKDLNGIATTYTGTDANHIKIYGFKSLAENKNNPETERLYSNYTLGYINLGIKPIYEPKYDIAEDIKYVKMILNNHQYVYEYSKSGLQNLAAPQVVFQKPITKTYDRDVYPSAIYDLVDGNNTDGQLRVYVVYEILIKNSTSHQEEELYQEKELHITSLTNTFDTNRYEIPDKDDKYRKASVAGTNQEFLNMENNIIQTGDFDDNWVKTEKNDTLKYKDEIVIGSGQSTFKYIQFKVKDDEIKRILEKQDGLIENDPTKVNTNGYHKYTRNDYSWNNTANLPKNQTHYSIEQLAEDTAPFLKFKLGKERKVTGTVFEDKVDMTGREEGEVLGNGMYDKSTEKPVKDVVVEIVSGNAPFEGASVSQIYIASADKKTYTIGSATATTNNAGEFSIEGIMPGDYYIRLTYGDGSQKIMNADGTIVSIDEYKSTIVTNEAARNALGYAKNNYGKEWYKHVGTDLASVAIDSLTMREKHNSGEKQSKMFAGTALIDITIENTESNYNTVENAVNKETFHGFSFGIIVQPKQKLDIKKKITNVRLINTPNILFNGNPEDSEIPGVTDLDGRKDGGSTYTRMEIEKENIYGSEISLKYDIEVKNISDINYYETKEAYKGWYYKFGKYDKNNYSKQIKISVDDVVDCYAPVLQDMTTEQDKNGKTVNVLKVATANGDQKRTINNQAAYTHYSYTEVLSIKGWGILDRNKQTNTGLQFRKILSTQEDDLDYINGSGVASAKNVVEEADKENETAKQTLKYAKPVELPKEAYAEAVITAPTGSSEIFNTSVAIISTLVTLSVIATGLVVIILKKRKTK